jgi:hypothetical protein
LNDILKDTTEKILKVELLPVQWSKMGLGLTEGELGIGIHPMTPYAAYAASFYSAYPVIYANTPVADDIAQATAMPLIQPRILLRLLLCLAIRISIVSNFSVWNLVLMANYSLHSWCATKKPLV